MKNHSGNMNTWYEATAQRPNQNPPLQGIVQAQVCVVGGGLAGLTTALELARRGVPVVVLEASRVAWAASGRNGGFVSNGFSEGIQAVQQRVGLDAARALYALSVQGTDYVRKQIAAHDASLKMGNGWMVATRHPDHGALQKRRDMMARDYGEQLIYQTAEETREQLRSTRYFGSLRSETAFHFHPLRYALLLAAQATRHGAQIFEHSRALTVAKQGAAWCVRTSGGEVRAQHVVHCVSSLDRHLHSFSGRAVLPVATYVAVTAPLPAQKAITTASAVSDTRRAGDYYRNISDGRILWGGRITTQVTEPHRLAEKMRGDMLATYPQLGKPAIDYAWGGLMGYSLQKMPLIGRDDSGQWYATAFGGHGMNTTAMAGMLLARAIAEGDDAYQRFAAFAPRWAGGALGRVGVQASYWAMQLRDHWEEKRSS